MGKIVTQVGLALCFTAVANANLVWDGADTTTNTNLCAPDDNYAHCGCEHASCFMQSHASLGHVLKTHHHPQGVVSTTRFPHKCKYHSNINTCKCICGSQLNTEHHEDWYDIAACSAGQSHTSIDDFDFEAGSCADCATSTYNADGIGACSPHTTCDAVEYLTGHSTTTPGTCATVPTSMVKISDTALECAAGYGGTSVDLTSSPASGCTPCAGSTYKNTDGTNDCHGISLAEIVWVSDSSVQCAAGYGGAPTYNVATGEYSGGCIECDATSTYNANGIGACSPHTTCGAGQYLTGHSTTNPGTCEDHTSCASTQYLTGQSATAPGNCVYYPVNCVGSWDNPSCGTTGSLTCGTSCTATRTWTITTNAQYLGTSCAYANGDTKPGNTVNGNPCPPQCGAGVFQSKVCTPAKYPYEHFSGSGNDYHDLDRKTITFMYCNGNYAHETTTATASEVAETTSAVGTRIPGQSDDSCHRVNLGGGTFKYFGTNYNAVYFCTNGYLEFSSSYSSQTGSSYSESVSTFASTKKIATIWDDYNPNGLSWNRGLYHQTVGTVDIFRWVIVPQYSKSDSNSFAVKLDSNNGKITIIHGDIGSYDGIVGLSNGQGMNSIMSQDFSTSSNCAAA